MENFPNYRDFEGLIGKTYFGEFPMKIMGNFNFSGKMMFLLKSPCENLIITLKSRLIQTARDTHQLHVQRFEGFDLRICQIRKSSDFFDLIWDLDFLL